jgi:hypothetical protein
MFGYCPQSPEDRVREEAEVAGDNQRQDDTRIDALDGEI